MDQIIQALSQRLNLPPETVRAAVGIILKALKERSAGTQFEHLLAKLPGAAATMFSAPSSSSSSTSGGGLLGGLLQRAGGALGGDLGQAAEALGALRQAGVPADKIAPLARGFLSEARAIAGPDVVSALVDQVPALKSLLGEDAPATPPADPTAG